MSHEWLAGSKDAVPPKLIKKVAPEYPRDEQAARVEGRVVMEIVVTPEGCVGDLQVPKSDNAAFSYEALWAVSRWRYEPAKKDGKAVAVYVTVVVDFKMR
jgi:protein TonB